MLMATDLPVWLLKVGGGSYGNVSKQQSLTTDSSFHDFSVVCNTVWRLPTELPDRESVLSNPTAAFD